MHISVLYHTITASRQSSCQYFFSYTSARYVCTWPPPFYGEISGTDGDESVIGILDTMKDLLVNLVGAVVFSVIGYSTLKFSKSSKVADSLVIRPKEMV